MTDETNTGGSGMDDRDGGGAAGGAEAQEPLRVRLERFGDAHDSFGWASGELDYVGRLGLTSADVPELVEIARRWMEPHGWTDKADVSGYAPIHAWRCLGQLRAAEAIGPLLDMIDPLDAGNDGWYLGEFPHVFGWIGPASLAPVREYLFNAGHRCYPRVCAATALKQLALRHPHLRAEVVKALADVLPAEKAQPQDHMEDEYDFYALVICDLLKLKAAESAEAIERAFATGRVDEGICGEWDHVREELGVPGLGLIPPPATGKRKSPARRAAYQPPALSPEELKDLLLRYEQATKAREALAEGQAPAEAGEDETHARPASGQPSPPQPIKASPKVGRNDPCPCGSGKKYKKCCGA